MIRVEYTPTYDDYRRLSTALWLRRNGWLLAAGGLFPLVGSIVYAVGDYLAPGPPRFPLSSYVPALAFVVVALVVMPARARWSIRRRWESLPQLREPREYEFTDDGIRSRGDSYDGRHTWDLVRSVQVVRGLLAIETNPGLYHFLRRDVFDAEQWDALRELVARHVPSARLPE